MKRPTGADLYDRAAARASHAVLSEYSTSFGLGSRLLGPSMRRHIEAVYGLVRIADEIVDTYRGPGAGEALDRLEAEATSAVATGWSSDLVVHSFARTARAVDIRDTETVPFFDSMRMDLTVRAHDKASYERYVYGSAEVVGLMCLQVFLNAAGKFPGEEPRRPDASTAQGAQALGAAFQKINFLRDLREDAELGRSYFPGVRPDTFDQETLDMLLAEIRTDVADARAALPALARRPRAAVAATLALYDRLLTRLEAASPEDLWNRRVRVPDAEKLAVAAFAAVRAR
ncbi:phytoene synthase [Paraoerskovia sediminicola]|uniref:Phytoene synthase n=1 Tax=Paraoerskovia sediminicola TaxID=1138587 RepID=A0ABM8G0L1_9CELL|nr:squalene/phytoene synthase family protein [Paraoerskovia sediminicola]BDZ41545.1 phytoene synthase [Paraoerskovia sediminicola]